MKVKTSLLLILSLFFCVEFLSAQTFYNSYAEIPDAGVFAKTTDDGYRLTHYSTSFLGSTNYKYVEVDNNGEVLITLAEVDLELPVPFDNTQSYYFNGIQMSSGSFVLGYVGTNTNGGLVLTQYSKDGEFIHSFDTDIPGGSILNIVKPVFSELENGNLLVVFKYTEPDNNGNSVEKVALWEYDLNTQSYISQIDWITSANLPNFAIQGVAIGPAGDFYVSGGLIAEENKYLFKLSPTGEELWWKEIASTAIFRFDLAPVADGVWVWREDFISNKITKYDNDGNEEIVLTYTFAGDTPLFYRGIEASDYNGILIVGQGSSTGGLATVLVEPDGTFGTLNNYEFPAFDYAQGQRTADGGYLFAAVDFGESGKLLKLDANGQFQTDPPVEDFVDLQLSSTGSTETPELWNNHSVTISISNTGALPATEVSVNIPRPEGEVYVGGNEYVASQGTFNVYGGAEKIWQVGDLAAGAETTITINYFRIGAVPFFQYAEVFSQNEDDLDSAPGNGNGVTANEDDETVFPAQDPVDNCSITNLGLEVICLDNETPDDPSDDRFTFTLDISGSSLGATYDLNSEDFAWQNVPYTSQGNAGTFLINDGGFDITVIDESGNCSETIFVNPPVPCSNATCEVDLLITVPNCTDSNTPDDPSDDGFTYFITANSNSQSTYTIFLTSQGGLTTVNNRAYGQEYFFVSPANFGNVTIEVIDDTDQSCIATGLVTVPDNCPILTPVECEGDLIGNSGFEQSNSNLNFWENLIGAGLTNDANSGNNAMLMDASIDGGIFQTRAAVPGVEYTFSAYAKRTGGETTSEENFISLKFLTDDFLPIETVIDVIEISSDYQYYQITAIAPPNATNVEVKIEKGAGDFELIVDDCCLVNGPGDPCNPDLEPPVIIDCPEDIEVSTTETSTTVDWEHPTGTDNCNGPSLSPNFIPGVSQFPIGISTVTYLALDNAGNEAVCSFTVTVVEEQDPCEVDIEVPIITNCPDDINISTSDIEGVSVNWNEPVATDECSNTELISDYNSGDIFQEGTTTVTYLAADAAGNTTNCSFQVTVSINEPPGDCANNMLFDPGFEEGFNPFYWQNNFYINGSVSTDAYTGNQAIKISSDNLPGRVYQGSLTAVPGETYTLSAFAKISDLNEEGNIYIKFLSASYQPLLKTTTAISSTNYSQFIVNSTAPAGAEHIEIGVEKSYGAYDVFADEFCFEPGNPAPLPDLILENVQAPNTAEVGEAIDYSVNLKNIGNGAVNETFNVKVYFSENNSLINGNILADIITVNAIDAGGDILLTGTTVVPVIPDGSNYILFRVDQESQITESVEGNNGAGKSITTSHPSGPMFPDLILENLSAPSNAQAGGTLNYNVTLRNIGNATADGEFDTKVYFSADDVLDLNDLSGQVITSGDLGSGQSINNLGGSTTVPNLPNGDYYLILKIDNDDEILESNENNNTISQLISVGSPEPPSQDCEIESDFPWHEWISNVSIGAEINNPSSKSTYSDFTDLAPAVVEQGAQLDFEVTASFSYQTYQEVISIYFDFNHNGVFETSERSSGTFNAPSPGNDASISFIGSATVPADALLGLFRARIVLSRETDPGPCGIIDFGEAEDYLVQVIPDAGITARLQQSQDGEILLYPNPVANELTIEISKDLPAEAIELYDARGQIKQRIEVDQRDDLSDTKKVTINTSKLINGIYLIQVNGPFKSRTKRVMVQRSY